jgi:hypothetical protein
MLRRFKLRPQPSSQPTGKTIDLEGRIVKDGVRRTVKERQLALDELGQRAQALSSAPGLVSEAR